MHNTLSGALPQYTTDMAQAIQHIEKLAALTFEKAVFGQREPLEKGRAWICDATEYVGCLSETDHAYRAFINATRSLVSYEGSWSDRTRLRNSSVSPSVKHRPSWRYGRLSFPWSG